MTKRKRNKKRKHQYQYQCNSTEMLTVKRPKFSNLTEADMMELETLFSKKLSYTKLPTPASSRWKEQFVSNLGGLETTSILWQDENLIRLKTDINKLKDQLSVMDIDKWHTHTTECNLAVKIIPYVRSLGVELCTQAWVKFYEIVNTFNIVPDQSFISVHLCEAPGAFIAALNHHLQRTGFCHDWEWCATTLNPYHESNSLSEMIADDRLIRFTHHKWYFGQDGSGDIKAKDHIEGLIDKVQEMEREREAKVLLVTADGSKDCQENPSEQESLLSQLHYCEMLAGCLMLADGGCLVIKIFTMFEAATVGLVYLLNILFEKVSTMKPSTSKSGNSEMYVVCTGYLASLERDVLWKMLLMVRDKSFTCFVGKDDILEEFLQEHRHICHTYAGWQSSTIKRNLHLYDLPSAEVHHQLDGLQESAIDFYTDLTNVESGPKIKRLAPFNREKLKSAFFNVIKYGRNPSSPVNQSSSKYSSPYAGFSQHKNLKGTFHLRQNINALSFEERIGLMDFRQMSQPGSAIGSQFPISDKEVAWWANRLETASFPRRLCNSRLCEAPLLDDYNFLLEHSQYLKIREKRLDEHIRTLASLLHVVLESLISDKQHLFLTRMQQIRQHSQQQQQHQHHQNPDVHHHQKQHFFHHKDQQDDSHHHHHQDYDDAKTDHHHYNNQQHQQQQEQQGSPQPVYLEDTFSHPYQNVFGSNHNGSTPNDPHNSSSENPNSKFNSPSAQQSDSMPSSSSRFDTETLSTPKSCSSPISEKDCPEPSSSPRRNNPDTQSNSSAHRETSASLRNDPESLSEPDCFLSLRPQKPIPKPSSPRRFRPEPQSKCYSHLSLSPEKHYLKQSSPQRNIPHSPSTENAFFKSSSPQSKCYSYLSLSPDTRYVKQSSPQRYIPESNSPSTENTAFKSSSPARRNHVSSQLKLIWINNGSSGDNYSQFQKSFSEYSEESQKEQINNVMEESIDIKDNLDTWDAHCDNRDCTVLFFLNLAQLFLGMEVEGGGTKSNDDDANGSDMTTASSTPSQVCYCEEMASRKVCLDNICLVLERLPMDSNLVILSSSFLTRFQAGLLYILARQFRDIQVISDPNLWLHQMVVCRGFKGLSSPALRQHLSDIQEKIKGDGTEVAGQAIMETVKFTHILNDRRFAQFVTGHNNRLLSGFINLVLEHHRDKRDCGIGAEEEEKDGL